MQPRDVLKSLDVKGGYRQFYHRPEMTYYFDFRYDGRYYRCIALPFGWLESGYWFMKLLRPMLRHIREQMG